MKPYTFFRSSASFRVRIALNYKGLKYEPAGVNQMLDSITGERSPEAVGPADALSVAAKLGDDAIMFYANPQRLWHDPRRRQCALASLTSVHFDDTRVAGIAYSEPAAGT